MSEKFFIDFFELMFLAEACIPPTPIARAYFWEKLTDNYFSQMSKEQRNHLFESMNRKENYKRSLLVEEETQLFHARFNPDNQYMVTIYDNSITYSTFLWHGKHHVDRRTHIPDKFIKEVKKV
jgi:hypothetical protein